MERLLHRVWNGIVSKPHTSINLRLPGNGQWARQPRVAKVLHFQRLCGSEHRNRSQAKCGMFQILWTPVWYYRVFHIFPSPLAPPVLWHCWHMYCRQVLHCHIYHLFFENALLFVICNCTTSHRHYRHLRFLLSPARPFSPFRKPLQGRRLPIVQQDCRQENRNPLQNASLL